METGINMAINNTPAIKTRLNASLNDILFRPGRTIWFLCETVLGMIFFHLAKSLSPHWKQASFETRDVLLSVTLCMSFVVLSLGIGQYERMRRYSFGKIIINTIAAGLVSIMISLSVTYFLAYGLFGRLNVLWGAGGLVVGILAVRLSLAWVFSKYPYSYSVMGASSLMDEIIYFTSSEHSKESRFFRYVPMPDNLQPHQIVNFLHDNHIVDLVVTTEELNKLNQLKTHDLVLKVLAHRIRIIDENLFYSELFEKLSLSRLTVSSFFRRDFKTRDFFNDSAKRIFDVTISGLALLALSPLLLIIAFLIRLTSPGKIVFKQPRQGRFGRGFTMLKFRTMCQTQSKADASGGFTAVGDARVTLIGKVLRPLHLDELPQLINIFIGDMSIVGPRPEALNFANRMAQSINFYDMRYIVRPGLTGHAQLLAGYMMDNVEDTKKKLEYDLYYIENQSFLLDMRIIIRTAFIVLRKLF